MATILLVPNEHHPSRSNHDRGPGIERGINTRRSVGRRVCDFRPDELRVEDTIATKGQWGLREPMRRPARAIGFHPVLGTNGDRAGPLNGIVDYAPVDAPTGCKFADVEA